MAALPSLSCVMPAFNEEASIGAAVMRARAALDRYTTDSEIIVVDDGSTDSTGTRLDELAVANLRILHLGRNLGYGGALRAGFAAATRPLLFFMDSDDQFDPMELALLLPLIDQADMVIGYRARRQDGPLRGLLSGGYNALVRHLLAIDARDVNCAFKLMRREPLAALGLTSSGYSINAEILARAARAQLRVREVPVTHRPRTAGQSKVGVTDVPFSLLDLVGLRRKLRAEARR